MKSLIPLLLILAGCATSDHYNAQRDQIAAWERVEIARAQAESRKYDALTQAGRSADPATNLAIALAIGFSRGAQAPVQTPVPMIVDPNDQALRWASIIVPGITQLASVGFGYKLGAVQSENAARMTEASYGAISSLGAAGFASNAALAGFIQAPQANITTTTTTSTATTNTMSGTGVLGSGSYAVRNCNGGVGGAGSPAGGGYGGTC